MTAPYYADESVTLWHGDCLDVLRTLPDASVDSVVTDPPYDLTSSKKGGTGAASVDLDSPYGRSRIGTGNGSGGFMGKEWDSTGIAFRPEVWAECLRVLKPGGHLLAFGGSRTSHRLACAVEDAGFEIRDSIAWLYGSGFPKSLDVSKAIDKAAGAEREVVGRADRKSGPGRHMAALAGHLGASVTPDITAPATPEAARWQGWGTALKPAFEPIVVGRKPLVGTVAANVLAYGTGALNIAACRVGDESTQRTQRGTTQAWAGGAFAGEHATGSTAGRWPTNVLLDDTQAAELDRQSGVTTDGSTRIQHGFRKEYVGGQGSDAGLPPAGYGGSGGASRFFKVVSESPSDLPRWKYEAKAPTSERPRVDGVAHPTCKPLDLMRWLVRLVTPPGGTVLDPFAGSGTTAEACVIEGFRCIAIEREADYLPLIVARLSKPIAPVLDFGASA